MNKIIIITLGVLMLSNVYAEAVNVKQETLKEDKEVLMSVLEKGQCGNICIRYERNIFGEGRSTSSFGFCRVSINSCKE